LTQHIPDFLVVLVVVLAAVPLVAFLRVGREYLV